MEIHIRHALAAILMLVVAACASTVAAPVDPALDGGNSARLFIYRPHDTSSLATPAIYLDDQPIGTVEAGGEIVRRVPAGLHRLTQRRPFFDEAASFSAVFVAGKDYYIRFAVGGSGSFGAFMATSTHFSLMDEAAYRQRK